MARVQVHFDGVSRGAVAAGRQTERAIDGVGSAASRNERKVASFASGARRSLLAVGGVLGRATAVGGGVAAGGLIGAIAFAGFRFDDLKQRSTIAFTTMLGSAAKAKAFLKDLTGFANRTPFELPGLIKSSQQLLAFGIDAKRIIPTLTAVGNAVAGMGGDPQAMEATIRAIGQVQAKGRLMAEEMMQLNEAGTFSWRALASAIGVDVPKAMKLVQQGAVSSDAFLAAFAENSNRRFAGMMDKQSRTFSGLLSTLKDKFREVSGTAMQPFFDLATEGMQRLVDYSSRPEFTAGVQRLARWLEDHVVPALRNMVSWIVDNRGRIADAFVTAAGAATGVSRAVKTIVERVAELKGALGVSWQTVFEAAFGALMLKKLGAFRLGLVGTAATGQGAGILGALRLLTANPWTIVLGIEFAFKDEIANSQLGRWLQGTAFGEKWRDFWNTLAKTGLPVGIPDAKTGSASAVVDPSGSLFGGSALDPKTGSIDPSAAIGKSTHETSGLAGFPAIDIMATPGTKVLAPADGMIVRHSGSSVSEGARGSVFGRSLYFVTAGGGTTYFITHLSEVAPLGMYRKGQVIGIVADWGGRSHAHVGVRQAAGATVTPGGASGFGDASSLLGSGAGESGSSAAAADPAELSRGRSGLSWVLGRLNDVQSDKVRAALRKRVGWITADLAKADTDAEASAITKRVEALKDRLADVLGGQTERQKKAAEKLRERMKESVRKAVEAAAAEVKRRRDVYGQAFAQLADKGLAVFDARTRRLLEQARVSLFGVSLGAGDETPAERQLRELRASRAADELRRQREQALAAAETPEEAAALRAQYALDDQEAALEQQAGQERRAADDALELERQRIQDERAAVRDRFVARLEEIRKGFEDEKLTAARAQEQLLALLAEYDGDFADVGALLGQAFAAGFQQSVAAAGTAAAAAAAGPGYTPEALVAMGDRWTAVGDYWKARGFAQGGKVPGVYIGRDSVPALLTPGEYVLTRQQTAAMEAGRLGGLTVQVTVTGNTMLGSEPWVARELAKLVEPELRRLISYQADR